MTHQELDFKLLLKLLDLETKSRLSNMEGLRSFCKTAAIDDAREIEELLEVHRPSRCTGEEPLAEMAYARGEVQSGLDIHRGTNPSIQQSRHSKIESTRP